MLDLKNNFVQIYELYLIQFSLFLYSVLHKDKNSVLLFEDIQNRQSNNK